jgi:hypothetical protein
MRCKDIREQIRAKDRKEIDTKESVRCMTSERLASRRGKTQTVMIWKGMEGTLYLRSERDLVNILFQIGGD